MLARDIQPWFKRWQTVAWAAVVAGAATRPSLWQGCSMGSSGLLAFRSGVWAGVTALLLAALAIPARAQPTRPPPPAPQSFDGQAWRKVPVRPGGAAQSRPALLRAGRNRCISINGIGGAQIFGDSAIELTMRGGKRWRLLLAQECPSLSFYQGFYYQQKQAGQLCAGRDAVGARSGGECAIAAIIPAPTPIQKKARRRR